MSFYSPVHAESGTTFSLENWFFYWKIPAASWRKIIGAHQADILILPIFWGFHSVDGESFDFGEKHAEKDLKRLIELGNEFNKRVVLLIALSPAPFLPYGGIPESLFRGMAQDERGMGHAIIDADDNLNKLCSLFDQRVYQGFTGFVHHLSRYLSRESLAIEAWGIDCGHLRQGNFLSYLRDSSSFYQNAYAQYLKLQLEEKSHAFVRETDQHIIFKEAIRKHYLDAAVNAFDKQWKGEIKICFISGAPEETILRINGSDDSKRYPKDMSDAFSFNAIPTLLLVPEKNKGPALLRQLQEQVLPHYPFNTTAPNIPTPFFLFELYGDDLWPQNGVLDYLSQKYRGLYRLQALINFNAEVANRRNISFLTGRFLDEGHFNSMLKVFMNGGTVILYAHGIAPQFLQKLTRLVMENNLKQELINYHVMIRTISLHTGKLIILEGDALEKLERDSQILFWDRILGALEMTHLPLPEDIPVEYNWRMRNPAGNELRYGEIRRLSMYNYSSYKKKFSLPLRKNFVLLKIIDQSKVEVQSLPNEVVLEFLPEGAVSLDFGLFD